LSVSRTGSGYNKGNRVRIGETPNSFPKTQKESFVVPATTTLRACWSCDERSNLMRKIILAIAAVTAVGTAAIAPVEARGFGRGAAIGAGIGAAALGAAVAAGAYNNGYYGPGYGYGYAPDDGYYDNPGYYDDGPRVYQRRVYRNYDNW
jgi:hypothetical protein